MISFLYAVKATILDSYESTLFLAAERTRRPAVYAQSSIGHALAAGDDRTTREQLIDHHGSTPQEAAAAYPMHRLPVSIEEHHSIQNFFARPVKIASWVGDTTSPNTAQDISPYGAWGQSEGVKAKLRNFAYFRGDLHIQITVNASPFFRGAYQVSYVPYDAENDAWQAVQSASLPNSKQSTQLTYLSQAPGARILRLGDNEPLEITIPFFNHKPLFRNSNDFAAVPAGGVFNDYERHGRLELVPYPGFGVSGSSTKTDFTIYVYAWVTNISLGNTTAAQVVVQSAKEKQVRPEDEYEKSEARHSDGDIGAEAKMPGPVEKAATTVSMIATALTDVPVIAPFARASALIASGVGSFAHIFGWSRPVIPEDVSYMYNNPYSNGCTTSGKSTAKPLRADPLGELSIDPSIAGVNTDDLAISALTGRESYFTALRWTGSSAEGTVLDHFRCNPVFVNPTSVYGTNRKLYQPTALAFAALPFTFWRGTLRFRFVVICSKFARGSLKFTWEPNTDQFALINAANNGLNEQNHVILDLQDSQEVCIDVKMAQARPFLHVPNWTTSNFTGSGVLPTDYEPVVARSFPSWDEDNGYLTISVFRELSGVEDADEIRILSFVSSPDMEFARPSQMNLPNDREIHTESGPGGAAALAEIGCEYVTQSSSRITPREDCDECIVINPNTAATTSDVYGDYFGERIVSFRALLKRFATVAYQGGIIGGNADEPSMYQLTVPIYPPPSTRNTGGGGALAYDSMSLFEWLRMGYRAIRGSMHHRIYFVSNRDTTNLAFESVTLNVPSGVIPDYSMASNLSWGATRNYLGHNLDGGIAFAPASNAGREFVIPYMSDSLFLPANNFSYAPGGGAEVWSRYGNVSVTVQGVQGTSRAANVDSGFAASISTGDDFNLAGFQGACYYTQSSTRERMQESSDQTCEGDFLDLISIEPGEVPVLTEEDLSSMFGSSNISTTPPDQQAVFDRFKPIFSLLSHLVDELDTLRAEYHNLYRYAAQRLEVPRRPPTPPPEKKYRFSGARD